MFLYNIKKIEFVGRVNMMKIKSEENPFYHSFIAKIYHRNLRERKMYYRNIPVGSSNNFITDGEF